MLRMRPAPTGSIIKLQREYVGYCLWEACLVTCDCCTMYCWGETKKKKKREPEATREECSLWTVPLYLTVHSTVIFKWHMALRQVNIAGSGSIKFVRCVARMCPVETKVMGEGIGIGPNPLHPPPHHFGVYLDVILWSLKMAGARTSETTMSHPKEL